MYYNLTQVGRNFFFLHIHVETVPHLEEIRKWNLISIESPSKVGMHANNSLLTSIPRTNV